jgi:hypothetical protein
LVKPLHEAVETSLDMITGSGDEVGPLIWIIQAKKIFYLGTLAICYNTYNQVVGGLVKNSMNLKMYVKGDFYEG